MQGIPVLEMKPNINEIIIRREKIRTLLADKILDTDARILLREIYNWLGDLIE